jgi:hypothetical protein
VVGNSLPGGIDSETPGEDWWFWDNDSGSTLETNAPPDWADAYQGWER